MSVVNVLQARLLFHEAATPEVVNDGASSPGAGNGARRVALLRDALAHARTATELAPASLSCAALRATLLANLLVENSTAVGARCGESPATSEALQTPADSTHAHVGASLFPRGTLEPLPLRLNSPGTMYMPPRQFHRHGFT